MHQPDDRRSFMQRLAGIAVAGKTSAGAPVDAAAEEAGTERRKRSPFTWRGKAASVALRHHEDGDPDHFRADVHIRNGLSMLDRNGRREQTTDHQLHRLLLKRGGRGMDGRNTLVIGETSYALMQSEHNKQTGIWALELRRYSGSTPKVTGEADQFQDLTGCGCGCFECCYVCMSVGRRIGDWFCGECGRNYCKDK